MAFARRKNNWKQTLFQDGRPLFLCHQLPHSDHVLWGSLNNIIENQIIKIFLTLTLTTPHLPELQAYASSQNKFIFIQSLSLLDSSNSGIANAHGNSVIRYLPKQNLLGLNTLPQSPSLARHPLAPGSSSPPKNILSTSTTTRPLGNLETGRDARIARDSCSCFCCYATRKSKCYYTTYLPHVQSRILDVC